MSDLTELKAPVSTARALTYLRVSSKRQMDTAIDIDPDGNSIATQRDYVGRKAAVLGTGICREFLEPGTSAQTIEKRAVFRDLLRFIKDHPGEIDYVIIYMRSRAFRNYIDAGVTERQLAALGVKLVSAKEDFGEGIWADAMKGVADIMNEVQVRMSGEDIRTKMEHKARSGGTITRAKLGYKNVRAEHDGRLVNTIAIDEARAPLIRQAFELYAGGKFSVERLADEMADLGLTTRPTAKWNERPVSASKLHTMLKDPYYLGFVVYNGEILPGRHEPIISKALFDRVQDVVQLRSGRGQRDRVLVHYLKGMLFCDRCHEAGRERRLIYTEARSRNGQLHGYFLCRGRQDGICDLRYLPVLLVERAIETEYASLRLPKDFIESVQQMVALTMSEQQESTQLLHDTLRKQLAKLELQEERLIDLAADGSMPQTRIRSRLNKLTLDRCSIEEKLGRTSDELEAGAKLLRTSIELCRNPQELYISAPDEARRLINETYYRHFFINDRGSVARAALQPPFDEFDAAAKAYFRRKNMGARERAAELYGGSSKPKKTPGHARGLISTGTDQPTLADVFLADGSSKTVLVGVTGFEPAASSSRTKRATKLRHTPPPPGVPEGPAVRQPAQHTGRSERLRPGCQRQQGGLGAAAEPDR